MKVVNRVHQKGNSTSFDLTNIGGIRAHSSKAVDATHQNMVLTMDTIEATKAITNVPWDAAETGITITIVATTKNLSVTTNGSKATMAIPMTSEDGMPMLWNPPGTQTLTFGASSIHLGYSTQGTHILLTIGLVDDNLYADGYHIDRDVQAEALGVPPGNNNLTRDMSDSKVCCLKMSFLMKKHNNKLEEAYNQLCTCVRDQVHLEEFKRDNPDTKISLTKWFKQGISACPSSCATHA